MAKYKVSVEYFKDDKYSTTYFETEARLVIEEAAHGVTVADANEQFMMYVPISNLIAVTIVEE